MPNVPDSSQDSIVQESVAEQTGQYIQPEPVFTFPPIAGFWHRFFAWFLDAVLVSIPLQFSFPAFLVILPYFGILNSKFGGGQTLGKRLFKIAVRNKNNEPIGWGRSILRIAVLALPILFVDWVSISDSIDIFDFENRTGALFLSMLFLGFGGVILYTMVFNRKAGQGIHDLVSGTYVVHLVGEPAKSFPRTPRIHYVVSGLWLGLVAIVSWAVIFVYEPAVEAQRAKMRQQPLPYDCLSLTKHYSLLFFSNTTDTAYRSTDGGITWARDATLNFQSLPSCSTDWPVILDTDPPLTFYYIDNLGLFQSLDQGETLTSVPINSIRIRPEPEKTLFTGPPVSGGYPPAVIATQFDTVIVAIGYGEVWVRLPSGTWIQYRERAELLLEPVMVPKHHR